MTRVFKPCGIEWSDEPGSHLQHAKTSITHYAKTKVQISAIDVLRAAIEIKPHGHWLFEELQRLRISESIGIHELLAFEKAIDTHGRVAFTLTNMLPGWQRHFEMLR